MKSTTKPTDDWSKFALSIFKLNGLIMKAGEDISRPIGQSSARWQVLGRAFEPQTVAKMARDIGYARQSVQRVANTLEKEGLIVSLDHPNDRRTKLLKLTPKGLDVLTAIYSRQVRWSQHIIAKLEPGQLPSVNAALDIIGQVLETDSQNSKGGEY
jgi:DNA-binding MarR family transcriptional regulator